MYLQGHFWSIVISMNESFTYSIVSCYWKYIHQKLLRSIVCWAKAWLLWLIFFMIIAQGVKEPKRLHEKQNQQGSLLALPRCLSLLGFKAVGKTVNLPIYLVWVHSESNKTNFIAVLPGPNTGLIEASLVKIFLVNRLINLAWLLWLIKSGNLQK